ncbi:MAG: outer membrane lipoprotein-sorting protein [Myxococcaceae bacterium]|nr:outer membrane lipoprotein-sorting protein [Myxococcaceae bacterium]
MLPVAVVPEVNGEGSELLKRIDATRAALGDFEALCRLTDMPSPLGVKNVREFLVFRGALTRGFVAVQTKPKNHRGDAVLSNLNNLFTFDAARGGWTRSTALNAIFGVPLRLSDLHPGRLSDEYDVIGTGQLQLDGASATEVHLAARPGTLGVVPSMILWVDSLHRPVRLVELSSAGEVQRTVNFSRYFMPEPKRPGAELWFPSQLTITDALEPGRTLTVDAISVGLSKADASTFTKAFVESQSR